MNPDIRYSPFTFDSTEVIFTAVTPKGREVFDQCFGPAAIGVTMRKSAAADFIHHAQRQGAVVEEEQP